MAGLTRDQLVAALRRPGGGSVILADGRRISKEEDLPPEDELARGDPEREAAAKRDLQRDILRLQERLGGLEEGSRALSASATREAPEGRMGALEKALEDSLARQAYLEEQIRQTQEQNRQMQELILAKEQSAGPSQ